MKNEKKIRNRYTWRKRISAALACIVAFVTVYAMVLPTVTLEGETAETDPGIHLEAEAPAEQIAETPAASQTEEEGEPAGSRTESGELSGGEDASEALSAETAASEKNSAEAAPPAKESRAKAEDEAGTESGSTAASRKPLVLEEKGDEFSVTAKIGKETYLPGDVRLCLQEIRSEGEDREDFEKYCQMALKAAAKENGAEASLVYVRIFELSFVSEKEKAAVLAPAEYTVEFKEGLPVDEAGDISIVCFPEGKEAGVLDAETGKEKDADGRDLIRKVVFSCGEGSLFAMIGTRAEKGEIRLVETTFTDPSMPDVSVSGMLPEGGSVSVKDVDAEELSRLEAEIRREIRQKDRTIFFVAESAYDIEIYDEQGNLFEPDAYEQTVMVTVEKEEAKEGAELLVAHEARDGGFEEPVRVEVESGKITYEAEHFSKTINGIEYHEFSGLTVRPVSEYAYAGGTFDVTVDFQMEELNHANFYGEIPYTEGLVDYSTAVGYVTLDGQQVGTYKVVVEDGKAYLCVSLDPDHASGSAGDGSFSMAVKALAEGELEYEGHVITIKDPEEEKYDDVVVTKGVENAAVVTEGEHKGDFVFVYKISLQNTGTEGVEGLTVYDIPESFILPQGKAPFPYWTQEGGSPVLKAVYLDYPTYIPGDGNDYVMTRGTGTEFSDEDGKQNYYSVSGVSLEPGEELSWVYAVYLPAEEAKKLDQENTTGRWTNYAGFVNEEGRGKEVSETVPYVPEPMPLSKTGVVPSAEGDDMEWTIALETQGYYNASGKFISDHLKQNVMENGLAYITDNTGEERPYVYIYKNGSRQSEKIYLTWVRVGDAQALTQGDQDKIYYDESGHFRWFSQEKEDANYGYELHYWTTFKKEWLNEDSINQAASNFSDRTMEGIPGTYETNISLIKRLNKYDPANRLAAWTIEVPVSATHETQVYLADYLPSAYFVKEEDNVRDTMDCMEQVARGETPGGKLILVDDQMAGNNSEGEHMTVCQRYYEFDSVAELEAFSGIHITVSDSRGRSTDDILLTGGKIGFYLCTYMRDNGKPAGGHWIIYPGAVSSEDTAIRTTIKDVRSLDSRIAPGDYTIRLSYTTNTPGEVLKEETHINITHLVGTTWAGNPISLAAQDAYFMAPEEVKSSVQKKIARVVRKDAGKIQITYMALVDNRSSKYNSASIVYNDSYEDYLSGLPEGKAKLLTGDPSKKDGVTVYKVPVTYDPSDPTGWSMTKASGLEDLEDPSKGFTEITRPYEGLSGYWGGITRESIHENGFMLRVNNYDNFRSAYALYLASGQVEGSPEAQVLSNTYDFAEGTTFNWESPRDSNFDKITKSSYYLVYTVEVDEADLSQADVLRNTIVTYGGPSGLQTGMAYQDYAVLLNELRKTIEEQPSAANDFTVSYLLDVHMTDQLTRLNDFTITDRLSDNLELDVQTLEVCRVGSDGSLTPIPSGQGQGSEYYTSMYTDHNLVIAMNKGSGSWAGEYAVRYKAYITDYEGRVHYENEARIPDGTDVPHITEGDIYVKRPEGEVTNLKVSIYKYDGNNTSQALANAAFRLYRLSAEKQAELKEMAGQPEMTREAVEDYLRGLPDTDWIQFGEEKTTGADGKAVFGTYRDAGGTYHSILFNDVYRLQETAPPEDYSTAQLKTQYFMFYTTKYPSYTNVEGIEKYIRSFVPETAAFQIPNYKASFRVYKTDAEDTLKRLTGVRFELFEDPLCTDHIAGYPYPDGRPAADGYLYFPDVPVPEKGEALYYLKEMQAPENYLLDDTRVFVVHVTEEGRLSFEEKVLENGALRDLRPEEEPSIISGTEIGVTVSNKPNVTEFDFDKEWLVGGQTRKWPEDVESITLTLKRTWQKEDGDEVTHSVTFTVKPGMTEDIDLGKIEGSQIPGTVTEISEDNNIYSYRIIDLEDIAMGNTGESTGDKWEYSISEETADGCNEPRYIEKGETVPKGGAASVGSGGRIQNEKITVFLPSTGGRGTMLYTLGGLILITASAFMYIFGMRRRERRMKGSL